MVNLLVCQDQEFRPRKDSKHIYLNMNVRIFRNIDLIIEIGSLPTILKVILFFLYQHL